MICNPDYRTFEYRNVPLSVKYAVEREYGLLPRSYGLSFETDHIIPIALSGSNDIANLYPEGTPGYRAKDRLENTLPRMVCAGQITLTDAQQQIAGNWQT